MSAETSTRPFQVGDRVRITDHLRHNQHPDAQYVYEGVVENIDPAADPDSGLAYGPYLWAETEEYTSPLSGETFDRVFCEMTDDLTTGADGDDTHGRTIELLEPAAADSPTPDFYEVRAAHKAAADLTAKWRAEDAAKAPTQDHGPLAAHMSERTLAKVLSRPAYVPPGTEPEPFCVEGMHIVSGWLVEPVGEHTCGTGPNGHYGAHEPGCGYEPVARLDDLPGWPGERASSGVSSLVALDLREAALERLAEKAITWADTDPDDDDERDTVRELLTAIAAFKAVQS